jgi:hypothetical protein
MIVCPWCDQDASNLIVDPQLEGFQCPACGTSVDLVEEPVLADAAA